MQALAFALAGCMGMDVVHILGKARQPIQKLRIELAAWRAPVDPRRLTVVTLRFVLTGDVASAQIERAIQLSRDRVLFRVALDAAGHRLPHRVRDRIERGASAG